MEDSVFDVRGESSDDFTPAVIPVSAYVEHSWYRSIILPLPRYADGTHPQKSKAKAPAAQKSKAASAGAAKGNARGKTQTTLKVKTAAPKKRSRAAVEDEELDVDAVSQNHSVLSVTPPKEKKQKRPPVQKKVPSKPLQVLENDAPSADEGRRPTPKKASGATEKYQKVRKIQQRWK